MSNEVVAEVSIPADEADVLSVLEGLTEREGVINKITKDGKNSHVHLSFPTDESVQATHDYCVEQGVTMDVRRLVHETTSEEEDRHSDV